MSTGYFSHTTPPQSHGTALRHTGQGPGGCTTTGLGFGVCHSRFPTNCCFGFCSLRFLPKQTCPDPIRCPLLCFRKPNLIPRLPPLLAVAHITLARHDVDRRAHVELRRRHVYNPALVLHPTVARDTVVTLDVAHGLTADQLREYAGRVAAGSSKIITPATAGYFVHHCFTNRHGQFQDSAGQRSGRLRLLAQGHSPQLDSSRSDSPSLARFALRIHVMLPVCHEPRYRR